MEILLPGDFADTCIAIKLTESVTVAGIPVGTVPDSGHSHGPTGYGCGSSLDGDIQNVECEGQKLYSVGFFVECTTHAYERSPSNLLLGNTVTVGE